MVFTSTMTGQGTTDYLYEFEPRVKQVGIMIEKRFSPLRQRAQQLHHLRVVLAATRSVTQL